MAKRKEATRLEGSQKRKTRTTETSKEKSTKVRPLYPIGPLGLKEREEFQITLDSMGLGGLLRLPWDFCSVDMVNEVFYARPHSDFKGTLRGQPSQWNSELIGEALGISSEGQDALPKGENQALEYFPKESISTTDGWTVKQCTHPELRAVLAYLNPLLYPLKPHRVTVTTVSTIAACLFEGRKTNWASIFLEVISKQILRKECKTPTSLSCYLVHLYKHECLLTKEELDEYETLLEVAELGNPDQVEVDHSEDDEDDQEVIEVVGPVTRKRVQDQGKVRVPDAVMASHLADLNSWSPSEDFSQCKTWIEKALNKSLRLESVTQQVARMLKCGVGDLVPALKKALDEGVREKVNALERQKLKDQIRIRDLEQKVKDLQKEDGLNKTMEKAAVAVGRLRAADPELMVANNLLKKVYKSEEDPKFLSVVTCNRKYAAEVKEVLDNFSLSLEASLKHFDSARKSTEEVEVRNPDPELKAVPDESGTGIKVGSGTVPGLTPAGSTSSAYTPRSSDQVTPRSLTLTRDYPIPSVFGKVPLPDIQLGETSKAGEEQEAEEKREEVPPTVTDSAGLEDLL